MELFKQTNIDFLKLRNISFAVSLILILVGIVSLVIKKGPNLGIDFTGGTVLQLRFEQPIMIDQIRSILTENKYEGFSLQSFSKNNSILIRLKKTEEAPEKVGDNVQNIIKEKININPFIMERVEFVGPVVGRHLFKQALWAILLSLLGIIVYVAIRFKAGIWGVSGVIALAHDVFVVLGLFSIFDKEITLIVLGAFLTLAGYSINDTIVIFDRIRENVRLMRKESMYNIMNISINSTLSRTILTSVTTLLTVMALFFFGGEVIHDFAFCLFAGIIVGSYSTIFVATPLVYLWMVYNDKKKAGNRR